MPADDALEPEAPRRAWSRCCRSSADEKSVALVAHEPILSAVAAALLHEPRYPSLRKAEALRIRLPDDAAAAATGTLRWRIDGGTGSRERLR